MRRPQPRILKDTHLPAPLGGMGGALSGMPPQAQPYAYNLIPGDTGLESRPGCLEWVTDLHGAATHNVRTVLPFAGGAQSGANDKCFAVTDLGIWDVSTSTSNPTDLITFANTVNDAGFGTAAVVTNSAGAKFLLYCDEENGLHVYSETTGEWAKVASDTTQPWEASTVYEVGDLVVSDGNVYLCDTDGAASAVSGPTGTGTNIVDGTTRWDYVGAAASSVIGPSLADQRLGYSADPGNFAFVTVWKSRVCFVEKDTARMWYLDAGSVYGTVTSFNFGSQFPRGGALRGLWSWTYDGGAGMDDALVAISGAGDVAIYQGTDPASASTFGLKGVWNIGAVPAGRRFASSSGGELLILSALGLVPLSLLVRGAEKYDPSLSVTRPIAALYSRLFTAYGSYRGWTLFAHPTANCLLVVVPVSDQGDTQQLAFSFATKGWYVWRDLPLLSAATWNRELYFGTDDGRICIQRGYVDNVALDDSSDFDPVAYSGLTAFWSGSNARNKQVQFIRPVLDSDTQLPVCQTTARYDYNTVEPTPPTATTSLTLPAGHLSSDDGDANAFAVYRFDSASGGSVTPSEPASPDYGLTVYNGASIGVGLISGGLSLGNTGVSSGGAMAYSDSGATVAAFRSLFMGGAWSFAGWVNYSAPGGLQACIFDLGVQGAWGFPLIRFEMIPSLTNVYFEVATAGRSFTLGTIANELVRYERPASDFSGTWMHIGLRESGGVTELLVNGVLVAKRTSTVDDQASVDRIAFGANSDAAAIHAFNGVFDDFAFFSDYRTDAEYLADYQRGTPTVRSGASAWDEAVWDTAVWDGNRIHQPLGGASGMGRAVAVAFQGSAIGRTAIIGFDVQFTEGGSL